jgi:hypothetical protein
MSDEGKGVTRVVLSPLEAWAYYFGVLHVFGALEASAALEENAKALNWDVLRRCLVEVAKTEHTDTYLKNLDPDEELFERGLEERSDSDRLSCFSATHQRLFSIRKARGVNINPPKSEASNSSDEKSRRASYSALENFSRLCGIFQVLDWNEQSVSSGALPMQTHFEIALLLLQEEGIKTPLNAFLNLLGCRNEVAPPDTPLNLPAGSPFSTVKPGDSEHTYWALRQQMLEGKEVFKDLRRRFIEGHEEMFGTLALSFVENFLGKYTSREPKFQVQNILYTLQKRLQARREAVEMFQYNRLEAIDQNIHNLLDTLKQYGIEATTYDQALKAYEKKFDQPSQEPPKDVRDGIRERIVSRIGDEIRLREDCEAAVKANPEWEDFIRREYQKEIDNLRAKR